MPDLKSDPPSQVQKTRPKIQKQNVAQKAESTGADVPHLPKEAVNLNETALTDVA